MTKVQRQEAVNKAVEVMKANGNGMTLSEISTKLHWMNASLRCTLWRELRKMVKEGKLNYGRRAKSKGSKEFSVSQANAVPVEKSSTVAA